MKTVYMLMLISAALGFCVTSLAGDEGLLERDIAKELNGILVTVRIGPRLENVHARSIWWGTVDTQKVKKIEDYVERLTITASGKAIPVPLSVYADLCSFSDLVLQENDNQLIIKIKGGDAASSYIATIVVKEMRVVERAVVHGEFQDTILERTVYAAPEIQ
jgi:hypothetical protein